MNVLRYGEDIIPGIIACAIGAGVTLALGLIFGFETRESEEREAEEAIEA